MRARRVERLMNGLLSSAARSCACLVVPSMAVLLQDVRRGLPGDWSRGFVDIHGTEEDLLHHYRDFGVHTQVKQPDS